MCEKLRKKAESNVRVINWASRVRDLLQNAGFNDVWLFPHSVNINKFAPLFRQRLVDIYINEWKHDIAARSTLFFLSIYKK